MGGKGMAKGGKSGKMQMMMQMMQQWYGGGGGGGGGGGDGATNYKGHLTTVYHRSCKSSGTEKTDLTYEVSEAEGQKGYQCTVTIAGATHTGEITAGKKASEHSAAQAALNEMFPDECEPPAAGGGGGGGMQAYMQQMMSSGGSAQGGGGGGKKRSHGETVSKENQCSKSRLAHAVSLILGRSGTKADTAWSVEEAEGKFIGSVTLTEMSRTFTGEPVASKKDAENAAADAALEALADQISTLEEEHKAKKTKKNEENMAARKLKMEERKAAKAAAKEA